MEDLKPTLVKMPGASTAKPYLIENGGTESVKSRRKRLTARNLSITTRLLIVGLFDTLESHDAVADRLRSEYPKLTGKTVSEVVDLHNLRKLPAMERTVAQYLRVQRRSA